jgi:hypothetical protein
MILLAAGVFMVGALGSAAAANVDVLGHRTRHDRCCNRARLRSRSRVHLRGRPAGEPRSAGQRLPARDEDRHPHRLPGRDRIQRQRSLALELGLGCLPAVALAFGVLRMAQSPRWLVMTGGDIAARAMLAKIRAMTLTRSRRAEGDERADRHRAVA